MGRAVKTATSPVVPEVEAIRRECWARGMNVEDLKNYADVGIAEVWETAGRDIDLTVTAICMKPRPDWVKELLGC